MHRVAHAFRARRKAPALVPRFLQAVPMGDDEHRGVAVSINFKFFKPEGDHRVDPRRIVEQTVTVVAGDGKFPETLGKPLWNAWNAIAKIEQRLPLSG